MNINLYREALKPDLLALEKSFKSAVVAQFKKTKTTQLTSIAFENSLSFYLHIGCSSMAEVYTSFKAPTENAYTITHQNQKFGKYQITPLILAVMLDQEDAVEALSSSPSCHINAQDIMGYTALHHAALKSDKSMMSLLLSIGANPNILGKYNATAEQLYKLSHIDYTSSKTTLYNNELIDDKQYRALTGYRLIDENFAPSSVLISEWANSNPIESSFLSARNFFPFDYTAFRASPPKLSFEKQIIEDVDIGFGVKATSKILKSEFIAEYFGELTTLKVSHTSEHFFAPYESEKLNNLAALVQDGLPNAMCLFVEGESGLRTRLLFVATRTILPNEPVLINYGPTHLVKNGVYKEIVPKLLRHRLAEQPLTPAQYNTESKTEIWDNIDKINLQLYILETPPLCLKLLIEKKVSIETMRSIFSLFYLIPAEPTFKLAEFLLTPNKSTIETEFARRLTHLLNTHKYSFLVSVFNKFPSYLKKLGYRSALTDRKWSKWLANLQDQMK